MGLLSAGQWPASTLPAGNMNSTVALSQSPPIDQDPMIQNNSRYLALMNAHYGTSQAGASHHEPGGGGRTLLPIKPQNAVGGS